MIHAFIQKYREVFGENAPLLDAQTLKQHIPDFE